MANHSKIFIQVLFVWQNLSAYQYNTKMLSQQNVCQKSLKKNSKFLYKAVKITKISNNLQYISFIRLHAKTVVYWSQYTEATKDKKKLF